jgi:hypothetical protein
LDSGLHIIMKGYPRGILVSHSLYLAQIRHPPLIQVSLYKVLWKSISL